MAVATHNGTHYAYRYGGQPTPKSGSSGQRNTGSVALMSKVWHSPPSPPNLAHNGQSAHTVGGFSVEAVA